MELPLVSVIVTHFNHAKHIAAALDCVYAQTWKNTEVIVVDDRSDRESLRAIKEYKKRYGFTYIDCKTHSADAVPAREDRPLIEAMRRARGKYISIVDSEDLATADKLAHQVKLMEQHPECTLCYGDIKKLEHNGEIAPWSNYFASGHLFDHLLIDGNFTLYIGTLIRASSFKRIAVTCADLTGDDWDIFLRLAKLGPFIADRRTVAVHRSDEGEAQHDNALIYHRRMRVLESWKNEAAWPQAMDACWQFYLSEQRLSREEILGLLKARPRDALLHFLRFQHASQDKDLPQALRVLFQAISHCDSRLKIFPLLYSLALRLDGASEIKRTLLQDMKRRLPYAEKLDCYRQAAAMVNG